MTALIVEDDNYKLNQVSEFVRQALPNLILDEAKSVTSGNRALRAKRYDLVLLDMSLPTYDIGPGELGWRPQGFGGRDVLRYIKRQGMPIQVIVITQYPQFEDEGEQIDIPTLKTKLARDHESNFIGLVYFSATADEWRAELVAMLLQASNHAENG